MNFIISVPGKLHCTLEKMKNCPGNSQVTGPGGTFLLRKVMTMGQLGQTNPRRTRTSHIFLLTF